MWQDYVQSKIQKRNKKNITSWDRMVAKLKTKFLPEKYQTNIFKRLQNLKQKDMLVKEYMEEFYKLMIRLGHSEEDM